MIPVTSLKDFYKTSHFLMYPKGTSLVYSNMTARKSRTGYDKVVVFGFQGFIKEFLINWYKHKFFDLPKSLVVSKYKRRLDNALGKDAVSVEHIERLWELGYLPIEIKCLPEGSVCDTKVAIMTIKNTKPDFFWLTNDLETLISCEMWKPITSATTAHRYRLLFDKYARETGGDLSFVPWQGHDFSFRGMSGVHDAMTSGAAHLLSFTGTDTIPAIDWLEEYYGANSDKELIGGSVYATEHSVMCMGSKEGELDTFERLLFTLYPNAPVLAVVSDTWSLSRVCTEFLPKLKERILQRPGKLVIRPDSGDPVEILCGKKEHRFAVGQYEDVDKVQRSAMFYIKGLVETLWDIFGGTVNEQGYKVLDPHIGAIYGDSITLERAEAILACLKEKGFASTNVVFGIGSYTYQYVTRDSYGFAMKATYGEVEKFVDGGSGTQVRRVDKRSIYKAPETDDGTKFSARGLLSVVERMSQKDSFGKLAPSGYIMVDQCTWDEENKGALETIFKDGKLVKEVTLADVRKRLAQYLD